MVAVAVAVRTRTMMTEMTVMVMAMATVLVPVTTMNLFMVIRDGGASGYADYGSGVDDDAGASHSDSCGNDGSD